MQLKNLLSFIVACIAVTSYAQQRYLDSVFTTSDVNTYEYAFKDGEALNVDVYTPADDSASSRPLFIFVHGGGFSGGRREDERIVRLCQELSVRGYVAASMSYRLTRKNTDTGFGCDCPSIEKQNTFIMATEDLYDCAFYILKNNKEFNVNPKQLIVGGSSAGAETALKAAIQPPMCFNLPSGPISFAGVLAFAGAIEDINMIDSSAPPAMLFHGTCDKTIPYTNAPHRYCKENSPGYLEMFGSYSIMSRYKELGRPFWTHTTCGGGHEIADAYDDNINRKLVYEFLYKYIIKDEFCQIHNVVNKAGSDCSLNTNLIFCK
ncbi:MAG: alpha/beta hydrolase [Bacteroidales bacterium]